MARRTTGGPGSTLGLFTFRGIKVQLHWSFPFLLLWVAVSSVSDGHGLTGLLQQELFVLVLFACVVLHEFGHALTAQRFGIATRSITLLPIGGVARLERMPEKPSQEFWVAVAGPAVNVAIVLLVGVPLWLMGEPFIVADVVSGDGAPASFAATVVMGNSGLVIFNMIPAFPMDGGRVLRALLALRMGRVRATRVAAGLGRILAVGFILLAILWRQPMLAFIGLFVILGAGAERRHVEMQSALRAVRVRDVMRTRFWAMDRGRAVQDAAGELLAGGDHVLFVTRDGAFEKAIPREELIAAVQEGKSARSLATLEGRPLRTVGVEEEVNDAFSDLDQAGIGLLPVTDGERLMGVLELDNLAEYVQLNRRDTGKA